MADPTPQGDDQAIDIDKLDDVSGGTMSRMVTHGTHADLVGPEGGGNRDVTHGNEGHDLVGGLNRDILHRP
jgi:hypothetical protein